MDHMDRFFRVVLISGLVIVLVLGAFIGGTLFGKHSTEAISGIGVSASDTALGDKVDEVRGLLVDGALEVPKETSMTAGAVQGLLDATGDKYAEYFDKRHLGYFNEQSAGEFGGIGVTIGEKGGTAAVVSVMPNTPALKAGMRPGDVFVSIDGTKQSKWTSDEVVKKVRGESGTVVRLVMKRGEATKPFNITRAKIEVPNTEVRMIGKDVGYVRLYSFNQKSSADLRDAISKLEKQGAKGFVLDLRDDPGGLLGQAVDVASLFIPDGVIVRVDERGKPEEVSRATGQVETDAPVVLLVNGNSASASEIVAGALQDHGRAKLVGEKTYGKGSVQTVEELSFGGAVKFTIAHYLTPKKRVINGKGLTPDYVVTMKPELQYDSEFQKNQKKDTQLQRALEVLRAEL
jgi:carboxyl-terminal processing protease